MLSSGILAQLCEARVEVVATGENVLMGNVSAGKMSGEETVQEESGHPFSGVFCRLSEPID